MTFLDLVAGDHVFLDANTLVYHFCPHPSFGTACNDLLYRIESQDLLASTSTHVLTEVAHRLMLFEASSLPGWSLTGVKARLPIWSRQGLSSRQHGPTTAGAESRPRETWLSEIARIAIPRKSPGQAGQYVE